MARPLVCSGRHVCNRLRGGISVPLVVGVIEVKKRIGDGEMKKRTWNRIVDRPNYAVPTEDPFRILSRNPASLDSIWASPTCACTSEKNNPARVQTDTR